ncbi:hypothetical protein H4582DRAFT_2198561 [Lactarius indigo]|nr:hypothetical protein H4582DRAFT_2198561 [Lactarius indigo]
MRYCWLAILTVPAIALGDFVTAPSPCRDDMHTTHSWDITEVNWESLGNTQTGNAVNLHVALKPRRENALIDVLYEIWRMSVQGAGRPMLKLVNN